MKTEMVWKTLFVIALALTLTSCITVRDEHTRYFRQVKNVPSVFDVLGGDDGGFTKLIEISPRGRRISDTLRVWVQHCPRRRCNVPVYAKYADLLLTCYPNNVDVELRQRHIFPHHSDAVWIYRGRVTGDLVLSSGRNAAAETLNRNNPMYRAHRGH